MTRYNSNRKDRNIKSRIGTNKKGNNNSMKAKNNVNRKNVTTNKSKIRGKLSLNKSLTTTQNRAKDSKSSPQSNTVKSRLGGVQKTIQTTAAGKAEVRLFTRHFDARSKIQKKERNQSPVKPNSSNGLSKKSFGNIQREKGRVSKSKPKSSPKKSMVVKTDRESTFTGKSIQIKTQNNLMKNTKAKKSSVKGNPLTVTTQTKTPTRNNRTKKQPRADTFSQPTASFDVSPFTQERPLLSPIARPVSAKVVISNLHHSVSQDDIQELFGAIGPLKQTILKNMGTAEVIYNTAEDAFAAYTKYHGRNLDGQPMILKITTAEDAPALKPPVTTDPRTEGFLSTRSSNTRRNPSSIMPSQKFYQPPMTSPYIPPRSTRGASSKPVVFTVKL